MKRTKAQWRSIAMAHRRAHAETSGGDHRDLVAGLEEWLIENIDGGVVVIFDSMPGEVDLQPLTANPQLTERGVEFALTRTPERGRSLSVHPLSSEMEVHRFGYRQPVAGSAQVADDAISAVLVPALAFDDFGNRLGFGAGYYDRFLARVPGALRIGIAGLIVEGELPTEDFDVPMTHLASIDGVADVRTRSGDQHGYE